MSKIALKVDNVSKLYRLGEVGTGTISHDLNRWWAKVTGKQDPFALVGEVNDRTSKSNSKGGYVWALKDIDFQVKQGEVLGIIGKNGAGKSTLLKLLSKITAPTTGSIKGKGRIASLLEVGTGMHPEMSGRENVYLNGTILGMTRKEIDKKFDEIMDFAGCSKYADTPVKRYSSGMKVRLGFAVAAFLDPEILIVDEVLAVGDAEFQKKAIGKIQEVSQGQGRTVLFVSHNMNAIKTLCTGCLVLGNGKVEFKGGTNEAIEYYLRNNLEATSDNPKVFDEDKEKAFQLLEARLSDEEGNLCQNFECESNIHLDFTCVSNVPVPGLYGYVTIIKNDGTVLIETDTFDHSPNVLGDLAEGTYRFRIKIPKRIIGIGEYLVYVNFSSHSYASFHVDSPGYILNFTVEDSLTVRGSRRRALTGTILEWRLENINRKKSPSILDDRNT